MTKKPRPRVELTASELEDFWAMNIAVGGAYMPEAELRRVYVEGRIQQASFSSSMGTAETYWCLASDEQLRWRDDYLVVPPGQRAFETPYEDWADDRDVDGRLWAPERAKQELQLVANVPEAQHGAVIDECMAVLAALDAKFGAKPHERAATVEAAVHDVMRRIQRFDHDTLYKDELRMAVMRALVAIAWGRVPAPVDVDAFWRR